jgi:DNA-binding NtrC family response regulator
MPESSILIVGPPSQLRDNYELSVRRHVTDVLICDQFHDAREFLGNTPARAIIVLAGTGDAQTEEFLAGVRGDHPHIPVFFVGSSGDESYARLLFRHGTVVLPPDMRTTQVEHVLFPEPRETATLDASQREGKSVVLERREYPFNFAQAKALFETEFLTRALQREHGNISRTARAIGIARRNLQIKIQCHGIDIAHIRHEP